MEAPDVEMAIKMPGERHYLVKMSGMDQWMKIAPEEQASAQITKGWQARVADLQEGAKNLQLAWVEAKNVQHELKEGGYIVVESSQSTGKNLLRYEPIRGPPPADVRPVEIRAGNITLQGHADPNTGTMYFRTAELPQLVRDNPTRLQQILHHPQTPFVDDGGFVHHLHKANYGEAAQTLAKNPQEVRMSLNQYLTAQLRHSDDFLAAGQYARARQRLHELIALYGERPELKLRQAIADIGQSKIDNAAQALKASKPKLSNPQAFFDEVNKRLSRGAVSQTERENLYRVAGFADWRDLHARHLVPSGEVSMVQEGDQLVLHYRLPKAPIGNPVLPKDIDLNTAVVYVQDSPGLNNLDWQAGLHRSLDQAVSGRLATVVHLPREDIAHFNPTTIYTPDQATRFNNVKGSKTSLLKGGYQGFRPTSGRGQDCQGDPSRPDCPRLTPTSRNEPRTVDGNAQGPQVYVVITNPGVSGQL
jgi:hypothetical protein